MPNSFYVEFKGILDDKGDNFFIGFTNGSSISPESLTLKFSMNEKDDKNGYDVHLAVDGANFFKETFEDATFSDGRLIINSVPSIFIINPDLLIKENSILLTETSDWKLLGEIYGNAKPSTATERQGIKAIMVHAFHITDSGPTMPLNLGFDPNTGILVYIGAALTDVLLNEMGINFISGVFKLVSFSDNLNFELVEIPSSPASGLFFVVPVLLISLFGLFIISTVVIYKVNKKRKR